MRIPPHTEARRRARAIEVDDRSNARGRRGETDDESDMDAEALPGRAPKDVRELA
ncbi:unnamed product, partial [Ostreococcus tauri]